MKILTRTPIPSLRRSKSDRLLADSKSEFQRTMAAQVTRLRRPDSIAPRPRDGVAVAPVADPPALKSRIEWSTYCRDGSVAASPRRS